MERRWLCPPQLGERPLLIGGIVGVAMEGLELFITQPRLARWLGKMPDPSDFADINGNLKLLLIYLLLICTLGALGEEVDYRGYLMNRVAGVFRTSKTAWLVSLIVVSIAFGCGHLDQGATGMTENILNGLMLGTQVSGLRTKSCDAGDCACRDRYGGLAADVTRKVSRDALASKVCSKCIRAD